MLCLVYDEVFPFLKNHLPNVHLKKFPRITFSITGNHDGINSFIGRLSFWGPFFSDLEGKPMKIKEFYDQLH